MTGAVGDLGRIGLHRFAQADAPVHAGPVAGNAANAPTVGQKIADAFRSFGEKVSNAFASFKQKVGDSIANTRQAFAEWKAERAHNQVTARLDRADQAAAGGASKATPLGVDAQSAKGFTGTPETISNNMTKWMKEIARDAKREGVGVEAMTTTRLTETVAKADAVTVMTIDTAALRQLATKCEGEGRTGKAAMLREMATLVEGARTPEIADKADEALAGGPSKIESLGDDFRTARGFSGEPHVVSNHMTKWIKEIGEDAAKEGVSPAAMTSRRLLETVQSGEASSLARIDTDGLRQLAAKCEGDGRDAKAAMLRELATLVDRSRTPEGASELFLDIAKGHMSETAQGGETFMRTGSHAGSAAVKKLMDANGISGYSASVVTNVAPMFERTKVKELAAELRDAGITHTTHNLSPDQARRLANLALEVVKEAVKTEVPGGVKAVFATLAEEINKRGDDKVSSYGKKLFSDQLVLKGLSVDFARQGPMMKMVADFINKSASGSDEVSGLNAVVKQEYARVKPEIAAVLTNLFKSSGMLV